MRIGLWIAGCMAGFAHIADASAAPFDCDAVNRRADRERALFSSAEDGRVAIGSGRVQFYTAPDLHCKQKGVFVLPAETLHAYSDYGDFTYVLYINPKNKNEATGWVLSSRLKETGWGTGPGWIEEGKPE